MAMVRFLGSCSFILFGCVCVPGEVLVAPGSQDSLRDSFEARCSANAQGHQCAAVVPEDDATTSSVDFASFLMYGGPTSVRKGNRSVVKDQDQRQSSKVEKPRRVKTAAATTPGIAKNSSVNRNATPQCAKPMGGTWRCIKSMIDGVEEASVAIVGNQVVVALGWERAWPVDTTRIYNLDSGMWRTITCKAPSANRAAAAVTVGDSVWLAGGYVVPKAFWVFTPKNESWTVKPPVPTGRAYMALVEFQGALWAIGGELAGVKVKSLFTSNVVEHYNLSTSMWTTAPRLQVALTGIMATAFQNRIYVFGGLSGFDTTRGIVQVYDPDCGMWSADLKEMPTPRAYGFLGVVNDLIFVIGGWSGATSGIDPVVASKVEAYDPFSNTWETNYTPMTTWRAFGGTFTYKSKIYTVGGTQVLDFTGALRAWEFWCPPSLERKIQARRTLAALPCVRG